MNEYEEEKLNQLIESGQITEEELIEILAEDERLNRLFKEECYGETSEDS